MELDDLKQAFMQLDKRFEAQAALHLAGVRRDARNRAADKLRPFKRAQTFQIVAGFLTALIGAATWHGSSGIGPFVSGVIFHVYGAAMIMLALIMRLSADGIDWSGPIVAIQRQLAKMRRVYLVAVLVLGLSWCLLWVPAIISFFELAGGVDVFALAPAPWLWLGAGGGAIMASLAVAYWWAASTKRHAITDAVDRIFTDERLSCAQADLADIAAFERD